MVPLVNLSSVAMLDFLGSSCTVDSMVVDFVTLAPTSTTVLWGPTDRLLELKATFPLISMMWGFDLG